MDRFIGLDVHEAMNRFIQLWLLSGLLLTVSLPVRAPLAEGDFAGELVRADYVEGLPYAEARELKPEGVERLVEMLQDPAEAEHQENIVMGLRRPVLLSETRRLA